MTNKEKAQELWGVLGDETRSLEERRAAREELLLLKKAAKTSILKLLGDLVADQHDVDALMEADLELPEGCVLGKSSDELPAHDPAHATTEFDPLDEHVATTSATAEALKADPGATLEAKVQQGVMPEQGKKAVEATVRGLITAEVKRLLLETDDPYADIVAAVKALHPEASTTARSVASVASDMRKAGQKVAIRRKEASK